MLPNKLSFSELYPFDFESSVMTTDEISQNTTDESIKDPSEEIIKDKAGDGTATKKSIFMVIGGIILVLILTNLGK